MSLLPAWVALAAWALLQEPLHRFHALGGGWCWPACGGGSGLLPPPLPGATGKEPERKLDGGPVGD